MERSQNMSIIQNRYFVKEKQQKKLLFVSHRRGLQKIISYFIYREQVASCVIQKLQILIFGLKRVAPKVSFLSVWETFQQMQYTDSCQLIIAIQFVEHQNLKNLKIFSFREDGEGSKVQKEKKQLSYLLLIFIANFILQTKNIRVTKVDNS